MTIRTPLTAAATALVLLAAPTGTLASGSARTVAVKDDKFVAKSITIKRGQVGLEGQGPPQRHVRRRPGLVPVLHQDVGHLHPQVHQAGDLQALVHDPRAGHDDDREGQVALTR
jgi:hypothetical protein